MGYVLFLVHDWLSWIAAMCSLGHCNVPKEDRFWACSLGLLPDKTLLFFKFFSHQVQLEDKAGRSCFAHCNAVLSKSFHSLSSITFLLVMFASHRPRVFRSRLGCCICGAKSSSSRFTSSSKYEVLFSGCFQLNEKRQGEICNACVLLVKRWKKLPPGSSKNWKHVSLSKTFVFFPIL